MRRTLLTAGCVGSFTLSAFAQQPQPPEFWPAGGSSQVVPSDTGFAGQLATQPRSVAATTPQSLPQSYTIPQSVTPNAPRMLPPGIGPTATRPVTPPVGPGPQQFNPTPVPEGMPAPDPTVRLPQAERLGRIDTNGLTVRRGPTDRWQVMNGFQVIREFPSGQADAEEFVRLLRDLRPNEWGAVGTGRVAVEYGLTRDSSHGGSGRVQAQTPTFSPKTTVGIDPGSVRVEAVRGVWVLRDDENILLNFGKSREDAEQAIGVIRKYGFNRLAQVGPTAGGATVLFAQPDTTRRTNQPNPYAELTRQYQEQQLTRTGLDVPAAGFAGERIVIDPKGCEIRRDKGHWVLAHGGEVLADFGASEWSARDALKLVQEQRFTEFCRFNDTCTFFLVNGQPPSRVPFAVQAVRFDNSTLTVKAASSGKHGVYEGFGRLLFVCDTEKEAKQLVAVLQHYGFDTSCQLGLSGRSSLKFLAKTGR